MGAEYQFLLFKMYILLQILPPCATCPSLRTPLITDSLKNNSQGMRVH
jgi:hypothetical protein